LGILREYTNEEWVLFILNPTNESRIFDVRQIEHSTGQSVKNVIKNIQSNWIKSIKKF